MGLINTARIMDRFEDRSIYWEAAVGEDAPTAEALLMADNGMAALRRERVLCQADEPFIPIERRGRVRRDLWGE